MPIHVDRDYAYRDEVTFGLDPSIADATGKWFKLGKYSIPLGDMPSVKFGATAIYLDDPEPESLHIAEKTIEHPASFVAINGIPYYYLMGKCTKVGDVKKIEAIARGTDRPSMTVRNNSYNSSEDTKEHNTGNRFTNVAFNADFKTPSFPVWIVNKEGIDQVDNALSVDLVHPGTALDGSGTEWETAYKRDSNMAFDWNYGVDDDDLAPVLMDVNLSTMVVNQRIKDQLNYFPTDFFDGDFIHSIVFTVPRGLPNTKNVYDDYKAQTDSTIIDMDMRFKMFAGTTPYIEFIDEGILLTEVKRNDVEIANKKYPVYTFAGIVKKRTCNDLNTGINDGFYGV